MMENKTVFVCFVHNNFDDLCGEDDISCLMVTDNQKEIDEWLEKQFDEAEENGSPAVELFSEWYRQNQFTGQDR